MAASGNYTQQQLPSNVFNTGSGDIVNWDGQAARVTNHGNGTRDVEILGDWNGYQSQQQAQQLAQQQQAQYQQANQQAIGGLQQKKTDLAGQYSDLLANVTQQYQPYVDQGEAYANEALGKRGLTPDSGLYQTEKRGLLAPYYAQRAGAFTQIGQGSIADTNSLANQIASLQSGGAQFSAQLPLQYGSLSLSQQLQPSQIFANQAAGSAALQQYPTEGSIAALKANTPFSAGNTSLVFDPSSNKFFKPPSGGGALDLAALAQQFVTQRLQGARKPMATIGQYIQPR